MSNVSGIDGLAASCLLALIVLLWYSIRFFRRGVRRREAEAERLEKVASPRLDRLVTKTSDPFGDADQGHAASGHSEPGAAATPEVSTEAPRFHGETVLIGEDDPDLSNALALRLKSIGLSPMRTPDATHALIGVHRVSPDLIILDVEMPSGNGIAVCEMLASDPERSGIPIIIHTGRSDQETIDRCKKMGVHYVHKSTNSWEKIKTLLYELLPDADTRADSQAVSNANHCSAPWEVAGKSVAANIAEKSDATTARRPDESRRYSMLYIDADEAASESMKQRLRPYGVDVVGAVDAEHAYMMLCVDQADFIVLPVDLHSTTGSDSLMRLIEHPVAEDAIVIAATDRNELEATRQTVVDLGAKGCLGCPVVFEELLEELGNHVTLHEPSLTNDSDGSSLDTTPGYESSESTQLNPEPFRLKVLSIDDDPAISEVLMHRLRAYGVDVIRAFNGTQGYWTALDMRPDVIISDMIMPEGDGNYMFMRLKDHPLTADIPVIVLTGQKNPALKRQMLSLGVDAYFTKPLNFDELLKELRRHIDFSETPLSNAVGCPS